MKSALCGIIILASASSLFSGEITKKDLNPAATVFTTKRTQTALNIIQNGLALFNAGESLQAKPLLLNGYLSLQTYDPKMSSIRPSYQDVIYNAVIQTQLATKDLSANNFDTAFSFADKFNNTDYNAPKNTRSFVLNIAAQARSQGNTTLADLCYAKNLERLTFECDSNRAAIQSSHRAAYNQIQWDYYTWNDYLKNVGTLELDALTLEQEEKKLTATIKEIALLARTDFMPAQCFLIDMYMVGKYGIPILHEKALLYCQHFMLSMAKLSNDKELPRAYSTVQRSLEKLSSSNPNAFLLHKYYKFLSARMTNKKEEIEQYCANTQEDSTFPYQNTIFQILSQNPIYLKEVIGVTPYDTRLGKLDPFSKKLLLQELEIHKDNQLYVDAISHFLKLCKLHANELFVECFNLEKEYATRLQSSNCSAGTEYAKAVFSNKLNTIHTVDLEKLIAHKKYSSAWEKIYWLMLSPKTRSSACQALTKIDTILEDNPADLHTLTSRSSHRAKAYQVMEQLVTQKDHPACVCLCLSKHYQKKARNSHADAATVMSLKCTALKHQQCALAHGRWSDAADLRLTCTALTKDMLNYCRQEILKLAALPRTKRLIYESSAVKNILETLATTNTIASDLHTHYNRIINPIKDILAPQKKLSLFDILMETILADSLYSVSHLKKIASVQSTDKDFNELYRPDSILPQLITEKLKTFSSNNVAVPNALNHYLGQWSLRSQNYKKAFEHLQLCSLQENNLDLQCLLFETHCLSNDIVTEQTIQTSLVIIEKILPLLIPTNSNKQNIASKTQFFNRLATICPVYIETLLNQKQYADAYRLLERITQLPEMRKIACTLLAKTESSLMQDSPQLSTIADRKNVITRLERFAKKKTHSADICQCMGNIFAQQALNSSLDSATANSLKQKSLDLLHCTLTHGNLSENGIDSLQKQCLQFAQELSDYRQLYQLQQEKSQLNIPALRPLVEDLLSYTPHNSTLEEIQNLIPESKNLLEFYKTDWPVVLPLLLKKLESLKGEHSPLSEALHTIIGLCKYHEEDTVQAHKHFKQCTTNKNNLLQQSLKLKTCVVEDVLPLLSDIMPLLSAARKKSQPNPQDTFAINMVLRLLNSTCKKHVQMLIEEKKYAEIYQLASFLFQEEETHKAGLHTLYAVEEKIVPDCDGIESISIPNRSGAYAILEQMAAQSNHDHHICCASGNLFHKQSSNELTSPQTRNAVKKKALKYFSCMLTHDHIPQGMAKDAQSACAEIASDLGDSYSELDDHCQAISYFKQAAEYGRPEAWLTAAEILIKQSSDLADAREIGDLLDKHAHSNATNRLESCLFLAKQFLDMDTITDKVNLLDYLTIAETCGNYKYAFWLGLLHHNGISIETDNKNKEPIYYLKPDHDKALFYYKKHLELDGNLTYPPLWGAVHSPEHLKMISLYRMGNILYHQEKMEDAYNYITQAFSAPLILEEEIGLQTLAGLIQMCITSDCTKPKGLDHLKFLRQNLVELETTDKITDPITQEEFFPVLLMTERSFDAAYNVTSKIIATGSGSQESIDWCSTIGYILSITTGKKDLTDKYRMHSIACLKFAADRGDLTAILRLLRAREEECSNFEKLYYIETTQNIPNNIKNIMRAIRGEFSPKNIKDQAEFILYCTKKNNPDALKNYCSHIYNYSCPSAVMMEPDLALNLLAQCSQVALVKTNADNFLKNPQGATPEELFSAILLGSLGSCCPSSNKQELMAASRYLQTIYDLKSPVQRIEIQRNLGTIYYKLGWLFSRPESTNTLLSIAYLEKAAGLHSIDAICLLSQKWLNDVPETKKIKKETVLSWLQYADALEKSDWTKKLLQEYNKKHPSKTGTTSSKPLVIERTEAEMLRKIAQQNTAIKESLAAGKREREKRNHPAYPLLYHTTNVPLSAEFIRARELCNQNSNGDFSPLRKLADTATPDPDACFNLLLLDFTYEKKLDSAKKYLRQGIIASLIQESNKTALFKRHEHLETIFMFIEEQLLNTKYDKLRRNIMIKEIKKILVEQNVDTKAFAEMFKFVTNKDISKHPAWK